MFSIAAAGATATPHLHQEVRETSERAGPAPSLRVTRYVIVARPGSSTTSRSSKSKTRTRSPPVLGGQNLIQKPRHFFKRLDAVRKLGQPVPLIGEPHVLHRAALGTYRNLPGPPNMVKPNMRNAIVSVSDTEPNTRPAIASPRPSLPRPIAPNITARMDNGAASNLHKQVNGSDRIPSTSAATPNPDPRLRWDRRSPRAAKAGSSSSSSSHTASSSSVADGVLWGLRSN
jgi:hypothetical protein